MKAQDSKLKEIRLHGKAVSRGLAVGQVRVINSRGRRLAKIPISASDVDYELKRLRTAFKIAERALKRLVKSSGAEYRDSRSEIFEAQLEMLRDENLIRSIARCVEDSLVNTEWAIQRTIRDFSEKLGALSDLHIREKAADIQDLGERLLNAIATRGPTEKLDRNSVLVCERIFPSAIAESQNPPVAIITERGGWTSHAFILARELGIPTVTGIQGLTRRFKDGDLVLVDGDEGLVFLNPAESRVRAIDSPVQPTDAGQLCELSSRPSAVITSDGVPVTLRANLDVDRSFESVNEVGALGVGLYRSEFLIHSGQGFPSEREQYETYCRLGEVAGENRARIRTFDIGSGEAQGDPDHFERNPALGMRATRLMLTHEPKEFRVQVRAILRAAAEHDLDILLPMISDLSEIDSVMLIIAEEKVRLKSRGVPFGDPGLGVMIEVPSLLLMLGEVFARVDFVCIGTNDLVQYLLAVDRDNEYVAESFRTLHPAVLRALKSTVEASERAGKPLIVCGEMAGSHIYSPILVGLGVRELSMNVRSVPRVRNILSKISFSDASELCHGILSASSSTEAELTVREFISSRWPHLFPDNVMSNSILSKPSKSH